MGLSSDSRTTNKRHWRSFDSLPFAFGTPKLEARLRVEPADFIVDEILAFGPDGEGEHVLLRLRKTSANTEWVVRRLASLAGVSTKAIGYAGLKDRHAITSQWFSVYLSSAPEPRWSLLAEDGIEVLEHHRHRRKLKRGALAGNQFQIRLRDLQGDLEAADNKLQQLARSGVPNYFGPQRFGRNDSNLLRAEALFAGRAPRASRQQRGLWLSAVRSQLFNELLARRVERGDWAQALLGDRMQLRGSHSHFLVEEIDQRILDRLAAGDLLPTGPLFGEGKALTEHGSRALEEQVAADYPDWIAGLARAGLDQERRALRLDLEAPALEQAGSAQAVVCFRLPAGSYATSVLRELVRWTEPSAEERSAPS
jgi:tRNA pseudouridine13 synthase